MDGSDTNRVGKAALVTGLISLALTAGVYPLMSFLDRSETKIPEPWQTLGGLYMPLAGLLALIAIGLGIGGLVKKRQKRKSAIIGILLGVASIALFVVIVFLIVAFKES